MATTPTQMCNLFPMVTKRISTLGNCWGRPYPRCSQMTPMCARGVATLGSPSTASESTRNKIWPLSYNDVHPSECRSCFKMIAFPRSAMRLTCFGFQMLRRGIIENSEEPFQIHLLALSTFEPHPLASQRIYEHHTDVRVSQISVRCMGNLAGVMFHSFEAELFQQTLLIFDWTTGVTKAVC